MVRFGCHLVGDANFFQVMTYHDALMSQLVAPISVVRTLRERLAGVEKGVVSALRVPQLCLRKQNLQDILQSLNTLYTLHQTQPTIQILLSRQEFAGALDLISTSQDIIKDDIGDVIALKHLPNQLTELMEIIGRMLLSDFKSLVSSELGREIGNTKGTSIPQLDLQANRNGSENAIDEIANKEVEEGEVYTDSTLDECGLSSIISGLIRQKSYSFLEYTEELGINTMKQVIKDVVLNILDISEEKTLTSLVAEFAVIATPEGWTDLLDLLVGAVIISLRRMEVIQRNILSSIKLKAREVEEEAAGNSEGETLALLKLESSANEVMINICDQVHERLGKLVTVRSRPGAIKLVTPAELSKVQILINTLAKIMQVTGNICGKTSAG